MRNAVDPAKGTEAWLGEPVVGDCNELAVETVEAREREAVLLDVGGVFPGVEFDFHNLMYIRESDIHKTYFVNTSNEATVPV